jgi:NAD(P)H dehydrogenase (quinone)
MTKILITGASGNFGRGATERMLKHVNASDLILMTRSPDALSDMADKGCSVRYGDFDDYDSLVKAFEGAEKMLMISGSRVGQRMPQHTNAINAAKACGVKYVIYTSFVGAEPDNASLAVSDHLGTEKLLRESGITWTALRNSQYADYIFASAPNAIRSGTWLSSSADGTVAHVWREDCIDAAVAVLSSDGHDNTVYNITGPSLLKVRDVADIVKDVTKADFDYVEITDEGMYEFFDSLGVPRSPVDDHVASDIPWCSDDMVSFERTIREGGFSIISNDFEKLTGKKPRSLRTLAEANSDLLMPL